MSETQLQNQTQFWIDTTPGYFECVLVPIICVFGLVSNIICLYIFQILEFCNKTDIETQLYKNLKLESAIVAVNLFFQTFRVFFLIKSFQTTYVYNIFTLYFLWILPAVLELMALMTHTASTIDYYVLVRETSLHCSHIFKIIKASFIFKTFVMLILSVVTFSYLFFCFEVDWIDNSDFNSTTHGFYAIKPQNFNRTSLKKIIEIIAYLIRDFLMILILILMNILIYMQVKNALKNKKKLLYNSAFINNSDLNNLTLIKHKTKMKHASKKTIIMVAITSLNNIFGRVPILLYFIIRNIYEENEILGKIGILTVYISYSLNSLIFFFINNRFRTALINKYRHFSTRF